MAVQMDRNGFDAGKQLSTHSTSGSRVTDLVQTSALRRAVDAVLNSYSKRGKKSASINAVESLQKFWQTKFPDRKLSDIVVFEMEPGDKPPYTCYVTLPGGSCFGSFEHCRTRADAKHSSAKIALMNSVFNEHPSRCITEDFIEKYVEEAQTTEVKMKQAQRQRGHSSDVVGAYRFMLTAMKGKSQLEFQELMTLFQLLNWNGTLRVLRDKGLSRQDVLAHYKTRSIDDDMRGQMALDWVSREQKKPEIVIRCYQQTCSEIREFCLKGRELRFVKEKRKILGLAMQQLGEA